MKQVYYIKEKSGKWNFSLVYNKKKILSSHGQGYSRKIDCIKSFRKNCKPVDEVETTRADFNKVFKEKKTK